MLNAKLTWRTALCKCVEGCLDSGAPFTFRRTDYWTPYFIYVLSCTSNILPDHLVHCAARSILHGCCCLVKQVHVRPPQHESQHLGSCAQVPNPEFEGQTKTRLGNPEVRKIVDNIVCAVRVCLTLGVWMSLEIRVLDRNLVRWSGGTACMTPPAFCPGVWFKWHEAGVRLCLRNIVVSPSHILLFSWLDCTLWRHNCVS